MTTWLLRERHCPRRRSCRLPCWAGQTNAAGTRHGGRQVGHSSRDSLSLRPDPSSLPAPPHSRTLAQKGTSNDKRGETGCGDYPLYTSPNADEETEIPVEKGTCQVQFTRTERHPHVPQKFQLPCKLSPNNRFLHCRPQAALVSPSLLPPTHSVPTSINSPLMRCDYCHRWTACVCRQRSLHPGAWYT